LANIDDGKRKEWRIRIRNRTYIEYYSLPAESLVDNIAYFSKISRKEPGQPLTGSPFSGYHIL